MSEECIFCQIVAGEIPSHTVYEDETTMAFLDVNPLARGHTVVIPKAHHEHIQDLPEAVARDVFATIHHLTPVVEATVDADATNIGFNNGEVAGQVVPHVHGHLIPRFSGDGGRTVHAIGGSPPDLSDEEFDEIATDIAEHV